MERETLIVSGKVVTASYLIGRRPDLRSRGNGPRRSDAAPNGADEAAQDRERQYLVAGLDHVVEHDRHVRVPRQRAMPLAILVN